VTGFVHGAATQSDKKIGVVALVLFDMRRRGLVGDILIAGTNGTKFPAIREHFQKNIGDVYKMSVEFSSFPSDMTPSDPHAYRTAMSQLRAGDLVFIFTPDDLHYTIAKEAIERGLHVLITKPAVKTLKEHRDLAALASKHNVLCCVEVHKRWDPMYADARARIRTQLGEFSYFSSYMSQPKKQLVTFRSWAGKASDISYYLNSHHVDFHCWALQNIARPELVFASAATGYASTQLGTPTEDTITLLVQWNNIESQTKGTAVYTASWIAPVSDVHSQQRFHYMGQKGEVIIDQAHRGYTLATDKDGFASVNPLYMRYTPDDQKGFFAGQHGYGYRSLEMFVRACLQLRALQVTTITEFDDSLATIGTTQATTAILEAGRQSLDLRRPIRIHYDTYGVPDALIPEQ